MKAEQYLDEMVIDDRMIDFDSYINPDEIAKVRDALSYHQQVKDMVLLGDMEEGLMMPWEKSKGFRFRNAEVTIWTGYNGHKKSLVLGYVMLALLAQGRLGLIASLEMPPRKTLWRMCKQWNGNNSPTPPYIEKYFQWLHKKLWLYDQVGTVKSSRLIGVARYAIKELGADQIVIDSLMKCGIGSEEYDSQKKFIDELCALAKDTNAHIHLVAHSRKPDGGKETIPSTKYSVKGASEITDMADNVIVVYANKDETRDYDQMLIVEKQRHGEEEPKYLLHFDEESLQFKSYANAMRLNPEDWELCRWR